MFYRIKNNKVLDYADYEYEADCLYTELCTMKEFEENPDKYIAADIKEDDTDKIVKKLILNPQWNEIQSEKRKVKFYSQFFNTSLGWIRRKVTMKDGSVKDFLSDLLIPIKTGMELGQDVAVITYRKPDFSVEPDNDYMKSLQEIKYATPEFIQECLFQTVNDFGLIGGDSNGI